MANVSALSEIHVPDALKVARQKFSDMVAGKKNIQVTAISGSVFNNGDVFEAQVQNSLPGLLSSLRLMGKIEQLGTYTNALRLQDGMRSVISQVQIAYNTRSLVNINNDAQIVAIVDHNSNESQEERVYENELQLVSTDLPAVGTSVDFALPLKYWGLREDYLLPTGNGNKLSVRITLENDLKKVFFGTQDAGNAVTGYRLSGLYLTGDFYQLRPEALATVNKGLRSSSGISYPMFSYDVVSQSLPQATTQNLLVSEQYRNVVSNYFVPYPEIGTNTSGIPTANPMVGLKWTAQNDYPEKMTVEFSGDEPRNLNGSVGQSGKAQALLSVLNASKKNLQDNSSGYGWSQAYANAGYGVVATSFLKSHEQDAAIVNSGSDALKSNGQLTSRFTLANAPPANSQIKTVIKFTRVANISETGVEVLE